MHSKQNAPHLLLDFLYCGSARVRYIRSAEAPPLDQRPRRLATISHSTAPHGFAYFRHRPALSTQKSAVRSTPLLATG